MKQDASTVVGEVPQAPRVGFDQLDGAVKALCAGVTNSVLAVAEQTRLMAAQHLDYRLDGLQTTAHSALAPGVKVALGRFFATIVPELAKVLLDDPSPAGFEIQLLERSEGYRLAAAPIGVSLEPVVLGLCQRRAARLAQRAVLAAPHFVHRLIEVFADMKAVMHDVCLGQALSGRTHVGRPHVHGHCFDPCALGSAQSAQQLFGRFQLAPGYDLQHPRVVDIGQDGCVAVSAMGAFLV